MSNKRLTYSRAGVDVDRGDRFVDRILPLVQTTQRSEIESSVGGFAAISQIPSRFKNPRLVVSTDGVGTKVLLAKQLKIYDGVGIDLVAMSVNDILTTGAEPLLFLDYFATSKIDLKIGERIVAGIVEGCKQAGCALVGGETAEMPQVYRSGDFDLAGFCVGVGEAENMVSGRDVRPGDVVIGLPSVGVHSNGFSLVRKIIQLKKVSLSRKIKGSTETLGRSLIKPTKIYVKEVLALARRIKIKAMAHITGGGIEGNLVRVLPEACDAEIQKGSWPTLNLFQFLQAAGSISDAEMFKTFNMGLGFMLVISPEDRETALSHFQEAYVVGTIKKGKGSPKMIWRS